MGFLRRRLTPPARGFEFTSHFQTVHGARMHYVDTGSGAPILFLHGNPSWSYLWRTIIPWLSPQARCIAPDLIGMGHSDKPDLDYRFFDHVAYLDAFIEALDLDDVILVGHDWGSALGLHWARRHPDRVRGIALMEPILFPYRWSDFPRPFRGVFRLLRMPVVGWVIISGLNGFVELVLPSASKTRLPRAVMNHYRAPYPTPASRRAVRQWPREIPIAGRPADVAAAVQAYNDYLQQTDCPKWLAYGRPGGIIRSAARTWCHRHLAQLTLVDLGPGLHFLPEEHPERIGQALRDWVERLPQPPSRRTDGSRAEDENRG